MADSVYPETIVVFSPSFCITSENFQGTRCKRRSRILGKKYPILLCYPGCSFFHLVIASYPRDGHNPVAACTYLLKEVSDHERYFKNVKQQQTTFRF